MERIKKAVIDLYGSYEVLADDVKEFIEKAVQTAAIIKACKDAFTAGNLLNALADEAESKSTAVNSHMENGRSGVNGGSEISFWIM